MVKYVLIPDEDGMGGRVEVEQEDGTRKPLLNAATDRSPDGFAWGYAGSGPYALARSILVHHTGRDELSETQVQAFKREVIAGLNKKKPHILEASFLDGWLGMWKGAE